MVGAVHAVLDSVRANAVCGAEMCICRGMTSRGPVRSEHVISIRQRAWRWSGPWAGGWIERHQQNRCFGDVETADGERTHPSAPPMGRKCPLSHLCLREYS